MSVDAIAHLDFTPRLACELRVHTTQHRNLPATWVGTIRCGCGNAWRVVACDDGHARYEQGASVFTCHRCLGARRDRVQVVWEPINGRGL